MTGSNGNPMPPFHKKTLLTVKTAKDLLKLPVNQVEEKDPLQQERRNRYVPPGNQTERELQRMWQEILRRNKIGIDDPFFQSGGNSLDAASLVSKVYRAFHVNLHLHRVFEFSTIRRLARYIMGIKSGGDQSAVNVCAAVEKKEYYSLSSAQKRLYILQQMNPNNTSYNLTIASTLDGEIDKKKLEISIKQLIQRHESLKTSFELVKNEPVQRVHDEIKFGIEYYETGKRQKAKGNKEELMPESLIKNFIRPYDLSRKPILRVGIIKIEDKKHILMVDTHHVVSDGVSQGILIKDFISIYASKELPPLEIQYKDYSEWQNHQYVKEAETMKKQEEFWLKQFSGEIPVLNLPVDYIASDTKNGIQKGGSEQISFMMEEELTAQAHRLAGETGTTLYMVLLSVYYVLLSKYTGREDIVVGSPITGRNHPGLESIIGMFVNMLSLRLQPRGKETFQAFLEEVKKTTLNAFANQEFQFDELVIKLGLQGSTGQNPLFETVFNMLNIDWDIGEDDLNVVYDDGHMLKISPYQLDRNLLQFNLLLVAAEVDNQIRITFIFPAASFKRETIKKMSQHYIDILRQVVMNIDIQLTDIKLSHDLSRLTANPQRSDPDDFDF